MVCSAIANIGGISDLLVYPTICDYYFYLKSLIGIAVLLSWWSYKADKKINAYTADYWSSMAVASITVVILAIIGTLITDSNGLAMIQPTILLYLLALAIPIILIWLFKE